LDPHEGGGYLVYLHNVDAPLVMSRRCARQFRSRFSV